MFKKNYSSSLFVYLRLSSFISNLPYDMKRYIYEFLKNNEIGRMIYHTRLSLLTLKPSLYLLNNEDKKYLNNINKEYISLNFKGIPFTFKGYNTMNFGYFIKFPNKFSFEQSSSKNSSLSTINNSDKFIVENIKLEYNLQKNSLKKIICNNKNNFHLNNEKYSISLKKKKLSKRDYLLRHNKENKKIEREKKKKDRLLTLKKKYSSNFKEIKYLFSVYINEDDEYKYQEYLINKYYDECYDNYYDDYLYDRYDRYYDRYDYMSSDDEW